MGKRREKPPKAALKALMPLRVLEIMREGGDWYKRVCDEFNDGWRPRHPETGKIMNASEVIAWATEAVTADGQMQARAAIVWDEVVRIATNDPASVAGALVQKPEDIATLPEHVRRCIAGWSWDRKGRMVLKFHDKLAASKLVLQGAGELVERKELTGGIEITKIERRIVDPANPDG